MAINALGYLGVRSDRLDDWSDFAGGLLGMQAIDRAGSTLGFRMDDRRQRLVVSDEEGEGLAFAGWEVDSADGLTEIGGRLDDAGFEVTAGSRDLADRRFVGDLIHCQDPAGNRVELFHAPMVADEPFRPGRPIDGFKTGPLGMGHVVLHVKDVEPLVAFYCDLLGFHVSDFGLQPYPLYFFHVNGRHHSFAFVGSGREGLHHFMVEYQNLDDVGQGLDIATYERDCVAFSLGRHTNDYMTSFYATSPSGFFVESGWGGRVIDTATWEAQETFEGPSFWGHERYYLTEDGGRKRLREMRMEAAAEGKRAPALVDCPWLYDRMGD